MSVQRFKRSTNVFYDFSEERVTVQPMLYNYIAAAADIGDYDVIACNSKVQSGSSAAVVTAALNIASKDLMITGVFSEKCFTNM